ncbi:PepSY domain-containing protein [Leucobacter sp. NPDC077196]|uniref:PepSY domain-containing protein n=1 Tax=Leucobacter sp. NPDC077196 TaxID=3154959 RepID=UPI003422CD3B
MQHRLISLATPAALVAALLLTGCGPSTGDQGVAPPKPSTSADAPQGGSSSRIDLRTEAPGISLQEAVASAQKSSAGDLRSVELTEMRGDLVYRIELATSEDEVDITVDATDGSVLDTRSEPMDRDDASDPAISLSDVIDVADAMSSATAEVDAPVDSWTLGFSDGRLVFQFDFSTSDREVDVDALTGNVVEIDD